MARSSHVYRRYVGHKLYLAALAARKAIEIADDGADPSDASFWEGCKASQVASCDCPDCTAMALEYDAWQASELAYVREREARCLRAQLEAEPSVTLTGEIVSVEWEEESGYRMWERMDRGELDREIWRAHLRGAALSDIDEP